MRSYSANVENSRKTVKKRIIREITEHTQHVQKLRNNLMLFGLMRFLFAFVLLSILFKELSKNLFLVRKKFLCMTDR